MLGLLSIAADCMHLFSIILLFLRMLNSRSASGLSTHTQILYLLSFTLQLSPQGSSPLDTTILFLIQASFLLLTGLLVYLMRCRHPYRLTCEEEDWRWAAGWAGVAGVLGVGQGGVGRWVEAVAILPQLRVSRACKDVENITALFMACLGTANLLLVLQSGMALARGEV
jgi:hypothetical protein